VSCGFDFRVVLREPAHQAQRYYGPMAHVVASTPEAPEIILDYPR
jgi:hypothetical protein